MAAARRVARHRAGAGCRAVSPTLLQSIVDLAVDLTDARYGAWGCCHQTESDLSDFITSGLSRSSAHSDRRISPTGVGSSACSFVSRRCSDIRDIAEDPRSTGFPPNHPPMRSFLGAPIRAHGRVFGNIYLTDKQGASEFTEDDEAAVLVLATQAGVAIANAQLYDGAATSRTLVGLGSRGGDDAAGRRHGA